MTKPLEPQTDVQCSVLLRHFAEVVPLLTFVRQRFDIEIAASTSKQSCSLSEEQWKRLTGTLVGTNLPAPVSPVPAPANSNASRSQASQLSIHEAVQEAQLQILAHTSSRAATIRGKQEVSTNVLLKGYRRPDDRLESFRVTSMGRPGLINLYPNSMVTALLLHKEWHCLFERIGAEGFIWLLVHTSVFVPLLKGGADGSCFVQLTGAALSEQASHKAVTTAAVETSELIGERVGLKRKLDAVPGGTEGATAIGKRTRTFERVDSRASVRSTTSAADLDTARKGTMSASENVDRKPSEIVIVRSRMFYARSSRNKAGRVEVGLPSVHVIPRSGCPKELDKTLPSSTASTSRSSRSATAPPVDRKKDGKSHEAIFHERRTRHLAKYVFPRQFGLHNVFTGARDFDTTTQPFRDYTVREVEIKALGAKRTPKAVRPILPVLGKILARHDKLNYRALLDRCCPSRVPKGRLTAQERQQIVEDLAEVESLEPSINQDVPTSRSQMEKHDKRQALTATTHSNVPASQSCSAKPPPKAAFDPAAQGPRKPRYTNYAVPTTGQVAHFATLVIKSLLPRELFGSLHNQKLILSTISDFVRLRRYESFTLHQLAQSFRFTDVDWAFPPASISRNRRLTRQEAEDRKKLVLELLYWLFDGLLIPLLRTTFYVTETAAYRNKVLYFRQDDWHVLSRPVLGQLKESVFEPLTRAEALGLMSSRRLGYSHVRLLPKETGVRPIVNLRRRSTKQVHSEQQSQAAAGKAKNKAKAGTVATTAKQRKESLILGQSINFILQSVFHILTYEKSWMLTASAMAGEGQREDSGGMLSSSVFGPNEIYTQLKSFKQSLGVGSTEGKRTSRKLYFIKVDVRCAFDSIDQAKLLEIIERILCKGQEKEAEGYRIHRFAKVMPSAAERNNAVSSDPQTRPTNGTKREFVRLARPDSEHIDFFDLASSLAVALHDVVFVDSVSYRYESTSLILKLLRQHITENLVKIGKEFYRQRVGIPQGSSLSTLLCSFFYADMEAQDPFLRNLRTGSGGNRQSLLMRYTDDFLLITTSKRQAKRFYEVMRKGHPEYGCFISAEKTLTNFDLLDTAKGNAGAAPLIPRIYGEDFPWCGLTISTKDLGVSTDLARYVGIDIRDTLTVEYCRQPGAALVEKMIQSVKSRCHILFTDTALNGDRRVYANIYSSFLVAALKLSAYLGELRRFKTTFSAEYLFKAVQRLVKFTSRYIGSRALSAEVKFSFKESSGRKRKSKTDRGKGRRADAWRASCTVQPHYVHWLGYTAFLTVLSRQGPKSKDEGEARSKYLTRSLDSGTRQSLVRCIEASLRHSSYSTARRRMGGIAAKTLREAQKSLQI